MSLGLRATLFAALVLAAPLASAQTATPAASAPTAPAGWKAPTTSWGAPDLEGLWSNATLTTLERPKAFGERLVMTPEETAAAEGAKARIRIENGFWTNAGSGVMRINGEPRSSFLVEPKNGRLPALTPEATAARTARFAALPRGRDFGRGDNPESLTLAERCLKDFGSSSGPPMMPLGYNNTYQLVQTPGAVMILVEMVHDVRIIPIAASKAEADARLRPAEIKQWMGDSVGWYEGDTLVVKTQNFRAGQGFRGADGTPVIERWRRINDQQLLYSFEIDDPRMFAAPIKAEEAWNATPGPIFEYACAEGNYAMANILAGERQADAEAVAQDAATPPKRKR